MNNLPLNIDNIIVLAIKNIDNFNVNPNIRSYFDESINHQKIKEFLSKKLIELAVNTPCQNQDYIDIGMKSVVDFWNSCQSSISYGIQYNVPQMCEESFSFFMDNQKSLKIYEEEIDFCYKLEKETFEALQKQNQEQNLIFDDDLSNHVKDVNQLRIQKEKTAQDKITIVQKSRFSGPR